MRRCILVVEDDPHIRLGLVDALTSEGYTVVPCADGAQAWPLVKQHEPELVVLDLMLPHKSGYDVCREIRAAKRPVPILMLSAKGQEIDKVVGLELGADDYMVKPFGLRELLARVRALLRRAETPASAALAPETIRFGAVEVDTRALRGRRGEVAFELTPRELRVLTLLYQHAGEAVSRDRILMEVWGQEYYGTTRTLDQLMVKLRQKLEPVPAEPRYLLTVHGLGYRLQVGPV